MATKKALGILGGTFDPIHYGHLVAAEYAAYGFHLDRVIFMPAAQPPHKDAHGVLDAQHRLAMVRLGIANNPLLEMSTLEVERSGVSYTIDTMETLQQTYPNAELYFIMGMDSLYILDTWKDIERLIDMCRFIVVTRPAYQLNRHDAVWQKVPETFWKKANLLEIPAVDIASSDLRQRAWQGQPIRYLLPAAVEQYIYDNSLYQEVLI